MIEGYPWAAQGGGIFKFKNQIQMTINKSHDEYESIRELVTILFKVVNTAQKARLVVTRLFLAFADQIGLPLIHNLTSPFTDFI